MDGGLTFRARSRIVMDPLLSTAAFWIIAEPVLIFVNGVVMQAADPEVLGSPAPATSF